MHLKNLFSFVAGFVLLFFLYHLPEFFQRYYNEPLIWLLELGMLIMVSASYFVIRIQKGKGFSAYGLFNLRIYKFNLLKGLLLGFVFSALANLISVWLNWNTLSTSFSFGQVMTQTLIFVLGTLLPSLAEDILTRGYLFAHFGNKLSNVLFIFISALVFTLNHIFRLSHADVMVYIFILGLLLAWCLVYTRSLWLTLGIHWGTNIAYQFFTNIISLKTVKETGYDNYLLAACYFVGWIIVVILYKAGFFKISAVQR
jgi:membrane protease YdiL (CAAX protease family)